MTTTSNNPLPAEGEAPAQTAQDPVTVLSDDQRKRFIDRIKKAADELESVPIGLESFGAWSPSKVKCLQKCPFQFFLKYVLKIKVPDNFQIQSDPLSANVGKAAHLILEHVSCGKTVAQGYRIAHDEFVAKKVLTQDQWDAKVVPLEYNITKFQERMSDFNRMNPIKRVFTEFRLSITRDYQPTGFFSDDAWLRGVIDLVVLLDCMDIIIIDHKTGGGLGSIKPYEEQLNWYKVLFHYGVQKIEGAQTAIHFIGEGDIKMAGYSDAKEIETKIKNLLEMSLEGAIDCMLEMGYFKHVRGSYCKWCEYDNLGCKSGELKQVELETKKWIQIHQASSPH